MKSPTCNPALSKICPDKPGFYISGPKPKGPIAEGWLIFPPCPTNLILLSLSTIIDLSTLAMLRELLLPQLRNEPSLRPLRQHSVVLFGISSSLAGKMIPATYFAKPCQAPNAKTQDPECLSSGPKCYITYWLSVGFGRMDP